MRAHFTRYSSRGMQGGAADQWVLWGAMYWRSCVCCRGLVLKRLPTLGSGAPRKPCCLQDPAERAHENQKAKLFLLQCLSRALYWQSLAIYHLAKETCLKVPYISLYKRQSRVNLEQRCKKLINGTIIYYICIVHTLRACQLPNSERCSQVSSLIKTS